MIRVLIVVALLLQAPPAWAQGRDSTVVVTPGAHYRAGWVHRFIMGKTYRDLWATPIRLPVLDLRTFSGGLTAYEKGGGKQSRSIRLRSGDGRIFVFRALDKDPTQTWPEALRNSPARGFAEDQISSIFPAGALAVTVLEDSVGLINARPLLVVLPDDPRLGEWRKEFRGNIGVLEQRLRGSGEDTRSSTGASDIVNSETLFHRLLSDNRNVVDQPRYLAARLFDVFVGDWDRHADQWAWARYDEGELIRWVPVPRDRDWAMSRLDGIFSDVLRLYAPKYQSFGPEMGSTYGLTLSAEPLDRRLLGGISRATWDSVTTDVIARISDQTIDAAAAALPAEFGPATRQWLSGALKHRRDELPKTSGEFYRQMASDVEVRGSNGAEVAELITAEDGGVTVLLRRAGTSTPSFRRRFDPRETDEVRLYLFANADTVLTHGVPTGRVGVRIIPDSGSRLVVDSPVRGVRVYDSRRPFKSPVEPNSPLVIHRDWGKLISGAPWIEARPEVGLMIGGGPIFYRYGFRRVPYQSRIEVRAAYATGAPGLNADLTGDFRFERPNRRFLFRASAISRDAVRYFGLGNQTPVLANPALHIVRIEQYLVEPSLMFLLGGHGSIAVGPFARFSNSDLKRPSKLATDRPYGGGEFAEAGVSGSLQFDSRDHPRYPTKGVHASLTGRFIPGVLDAERSFGSLRLEVATFATAKTLPAHPTLALRVGATEVRGLYPFFEAASLGGRDNIRGLNSNRYLGDREANGSAELRLDFGHFAILAPGEWGIYGLGDVGRVWLDGETSDKWHAAAGGGLWFAFIDRRSTVTITYTNNAESSRFYVQTGFHF